jgi:hypothetical protein
MRKELLLSVVLAIGVVGTALWVADQSLTANSPKSVGQGTEHGYAGSKMHKTHSAENSESSITDANSNKNPTNPASTAAASISKCAINGKTVYSDQGCPDGAKGRTVALHDSAGIVSPPKENLAELTAKRKASEQAYTLQLQQQVASIGSSNRFECEELDKRIASLDAMARQPQSGGMQDWIKDQRKAVRDRQFAIHC